jgi:hypothetical protein
MTLEQCKEIANLIDRFEKANHKHIKAKFRNLCLYQYPKLPKGKASMHELLGLKPSIFSNAVNIAHPQQLNFKTFIKFIVGLQLDVEAILSPIPDNNTRCVKGVPRSPKKKKWDFDSKGEFLMDCKIKGREKTAEKYKLSKNSVRNYERKFKKERNI